MPDQDEQRALEELETFLKPRIEAAKNGQLSSRTVNDIFDQILKEESE